MCGYSLFSYIDPGTGGLLVSILSGLAMAAAYSARGFIYAVSNRITGGGTVTSETDFAGKLVFFNEGKNYWNVFQPIIQELVEREISFVYLTADSDDPGLNLDSPHVQAVNLRSIQRATLVLNRLKADTVVMTTPQLGTLFLKRSKSVRHYCHLLHAPTDIRGYKKFAFDDFDSVLCSSARQIENLRQLENDRGTPAKELFETGCTYYDSAEGLENAGADAVLVAPTWGVKGYLPTLGEEIIENLLAAGETVIFRPHPQSWTADREILDHIVSRFGNHPAFTVDKSVDNKPSLSKAKVMVADISGMVYDFVFLMNRPVIAIEIDWKNGGYESSNITAKDSLIELLEDTGAYIRSEQISEIAEIVENITTCDINDETVDRYIFNFRSAGKVATEQILLIANMQTEPVELKKAA